MKASEIQSRKTDPKLQLSLFWLGCFLFYFLIMLCAPYSYDDYEFTSVQYATFGELLQYCLTYGNGRLLGNLGGIVLNQIPVFGAVAKAFVMSTTVLLLPAILSIRSRHSYVLSFLLTTAIDPALFAQVFTWTSGFQNYVPPVFLMLVILYLIQQYPQEQGQIPRKAVISIALFVIGLAAQLYIEHSSIINLMLALFLVVKALYSPRRHGLAPALSLLLATTVGLILMFWIPAHFMASANNHTTGYRSLYVNSIATFIFNCARNALRLTNHYLGMSGVPLCAGAALTVYLTGSERKEKTNTLLYAFSIIPLLYMIICSALNVEGWYAEPAVLHHAIAMVMVLSALAVWVIALLAMKDTLLRNSVLVLLGFAVFAMLPLLIVTPIRIRVLYHSQIFIVMAFLLCLCRWIDTWNPKITAHITRLLGLCSLIIVISLGSVFLSIRSMNQVRHKYTVQQIEQGVKTVDFFRIPYDYVHDYTDNGMGEYYYHTKPMDVEFNILTYDQWMNDLLDTVK